VTGSIQVGKFADLIVLDRDPLKIPAEDIANVRLLQTVAGGQSVYESMPEYQPLVSVIIWETPTGRGGSKPPPLA
jgi:cytosine/adenosine deaminase-related metal-dependent hydrolase